MNRADLLVHFGFNQWANQRILAQLAKLSEEGFKAPNQLNHGSAFELLRHTLDCEWKQGQPDFTSMCISCNMYLL